MRRLRATGLSLALLFFALLATSAQTGAAKPQSGKSTPTTEPISALAMDGLRVAYMLENRRVGVWNVVTGATSVVKGNYPSNGRHFGYGSGEVAIAGKRIALITRFVIGNTLQTQERLYTASVGGQARQLGKLTNHSSGQGDCNPADSGYADGNWIGGLVGSGKILAVSSWRASGAATTGGARLSLITPTALRQIASGPGAVVSQAAGGGHIAVLRSTDAWPAYQGPPEFGSPLVGIYSNTGALLREVALDVAPPSLCGYPNTFIRIALSGDRLVVLRLDEPEAGSLTAEVEIYDWRKGVLLDTWPLALSHVAPISDRLIASGRLAVVEGAFKLRLVDLDTGKTATITASRPNSPATIGSRGLVYAVNTYRGGHPGKLVFVSTAKLLAALGE